MRALRLSKLLSTTAGTLLLVVDSVGVTALDFGEEKGDDGTGETASDED